MSLTLTTMLIGVGIAAIIFLAMQIFISKEYEHYFIRFLQAFVGILFLFSGGVKAVDPLGTAYKMEQYFAEFESLFDSTWFSFLGPLFPFLESYVVAFSVFMIVFEIVLGYMLLMGIKKKFTTWALFLLILFFTALTGFTFLTGYVPADGSFFNFSSWGSFSENNMKVKDCGCFGDFIKLVPKTSFFKDVFLLIPSILFLLYSSKMYTVLKPKWERISTLFLLTVTLIYCFSNYVWDIPHVDFRPFKEGVNITKQKEIEEEAAGNVQVIGFVMKNIEDPNRTMEITMEEYTNNYKIYEGEWEVADQLKTKPTMTLSKISEFDLSNLDGDVATDEFLYHEGKSVVIITKALKGVSTSSMRTVTDTILILDEVSGEESMKLVNNEVEDVDFIADYYYEEAFREKVIPFVNEARAAGYDIQFIVAGASPSEIVNFMEDIKLEATAYTADDILLKTIIRSNPGIMIMDGGMILNKFHIRKLPSFQEYSNQ